MKLLLLAIAKCVLMSDWVNIKETQIPGLWVVN